MTARRWTLLCMVWLIAATGLADARQSVGAEDVEGELEVRVEDSTTGARVDHFLHARGKRFRIQYPGVAPGYSSGHRIRARGKIVGETLELSSDPNAVTVLALSTSGTFGEQRTLVILVNFQDNPSVPYSPATAAAVTFQTTSDFFRENSYGQTWLTGDVAGWYTIAMSSSTCNTDQLATLANQAASANGFNVNQYRRIVYGFPNNACSWWGLGTIGGNPSRAWIKGNYQLKVVAHELGHNFGDYHSQSTPCSSSGCSNVEYGDDRDVMGNPNSGHLTAFQKERLGWLNYGASPAIQSVTSSGAYFIDPLHTPGGSKALKILKGTEANGARTYYYVEARVQAGFDNQMPGGVIVHTGTENVANSSYQIDLAPTTTAFDSVLDPNQSFNDAAAGITIRTTSAGAGGATVQVTMNGSCTSRAPALSATPAAAVSVTSGAGVSYAVTVTNTDDDGCGSATFSPQGTVPSGWSAAAAPASVTVAPGANASFTMTVTSAVAASGSFAATISVTRSAGPGNSLSRTIIATPINCTRATPVIAIDPVTTQLAQPGVAVSYAISVRNGDSAQCGASTVFLDLTLPGGASGGLAPASLTLAPGTTGSTTLFVDAGSMSPGPALATVRTRRNETPNVVSAVSARILATTPAPLAGRFDVDGDGRTDIGAFQAGTGMWHALMSGNAFSAHTPFSAQWGWSSDVPIPGDFDGDGRIDLTVYRPSDGTWYTRYSSSNYTYANWTQFQWGAWGDVPVAADLDGDRRNDLVVFRPTTGEWFVRHSSQGFSYAGWKSYGWGLPGDQPLSGDFDGDGRSDLTIYRPTTGQWFVLFSAAGYSTWAAFQWGATGDVPLTRDFDGDGRTDLAVYRPATGDWFLRFSSANFSAANWAWYQWGIPGDVPAPIDFDGDGRADLAVWRPSTREWFGLPSRGGYAVANWVKFTWSQADLLPLR